MPDFPVCNSTVCPVRTNCAINWDSGKIAPDRDPKVQLWVDDRPQHHWRRPDPRTHDAFCDYYEPIDYELAYRHEKRARCVLAEAWTRRELEVGKALQSVLLSSNTPAKAIADSRDEQFAEKQASHAAARQWRHADE